MIVLKRRLLTWPKYMTIRWGAVHTDSILIKGKQNWNCFDSGKTPNKLMKTTFEDVRLMYKSHLYGKYCRYLETFVSGHQTFVSFDWTLAN